MTRDSLVTLALLLALVVLSAVVGGSIGASWAWAEATDRLSEAREAQAQAALLSLDCHHLAQDCLGYRGRR